MSSLTRFDEQLKKHSHYQVHEQMLPFVGEQYEKHRILLVSESHYVPKEVKIQPTDTWYKTSVAGYLHGNTDTRTIFSKILTDAGKAHSLFHNLKSALAASEKQIRMNEITWYNFFQKPANHKISIQSASEDQRIALEVFEHVLDTLQPQLVIFISRFSFAVLGKKQENYPQPRVWNNDLGGHQYKNYPIPIQVTPHPNSAWWNKPSNTCKLPNTSIKRTGRQKFIDILNQHPSVAVPEQAL